MSVAMTIITSVQVIAETPKPPYYAVIFASELSDNIQDYAEATKQMTELVKSQPGYLGEDSARSEIGITVSYWQDLESIDGWRKNMDHLAVKEKGKSQWYKNYTLRIAKVERQY